MTQPLLATSARAVNAAVDARTGVAVLTLDDPAGSANRMTLGLARELGAALDAVFADPTVVAVVLASGKRDSFVVGPSVDGARALLFARDAEEAAREIAGRFSRLRVAPKPVVAWVRGAALGAGFELALACTAAVAADDPATVLGLPDVELGLVPAANGLLRVAERAGLRVALEMGLAGQPIHAAKARRLGLVDDVVPAGVGLEAAKAFALRLAADPTIAARLPKLRRRASGSQVVRFVAEDNPIGRALLFRRLRRDALGRTRGQYPAAERMIDLLARFGARGLRSAADLEPRLFADLAVGETAHRLADLSAAKALLQRESGLEAGEWAPPRTVAVVGVSGAGPFGARLAAAAIETGLDVRRRADQLGAADLVVESALDTLAAKQAALREIERVVRDDCVILSTSATLSVERLVESSAQPRRIVGMHEGLVRATSLVEVVRFAGTEPRAVATAVAFAKRLGKTVIVVRDAPLFYTPRILMPYLSEAFHLVTEGASSDVVDAAMLDWGFRVGPFQLLAELGFALSTRLGRAAEAAFGARLGITRAFPTLARRDRERKSHGRSPPAPFTREEISLRCSLAMLNEVLRCRADEVVRSARDADVAGVLGAGFPAFRGGPLRYVDVIGAVEILRRMRLLEQRFGARFEPAPLLVEAARGGKRFYG